MREREKCMCVGVEEDGLGTWNFVRKEGPLSVLLSSHKMMLCRFRVMMMSVTEAMTTRIRDVSVAQV